MQCRMHAISDVFTYIFICSYRSFWIYHLLLCTVHYVLTYGIITLMLGNTKALLFIKTSFIHLLTPGVTASCSV